MQLLFRPQSLYLLFAVLCTGSMMLFPFATFESTGEDEFHELMASGFLNHEAVQVVDVAPVVPLDIVVAVLGLILLVSIFLFKNRKRQSTVASASFIVVLLMVAGAYLAINSFKAYLGTEADSTVQFGPSFYLPFAAAAFTWLAIRRIKKDEELVRSLDRLR